MRVGRVRGDDLIIDVRNGRGEHLLRLVGEAEVDHRTAGPLRDEIVGGHELHRAGAGAPTYPPRLTEDDALAVHEEHANTLDAGALARLDDERLRIRAHPGDARRKRREIGARQLVVVRSRLGFAQRIGVLHRREPNASRRVAALRERVERRRGRGVLVPTEAEAVVETAGWILRLDAHDHLSFIRPEANIHFARTTLLAHVLAVGELDREHPHRHRRMILDKDRVRNRIGIVHLGGADDGFVGWRDVRVVRGGRAGEQQPGDEEREAVHEEALMNGKGRRLTASRAVRESACHPMHGPRQGLRWGILAVRTELDHQRSRPQIVVRR